MEIILPPIGQTLIVGGSVGGATEVERIKPLPFPEFTFSVVFDLMLPRDRYDMIDEYHRILKYNGRLSFVVECASDEEIKRVMDGFRVHNRKVVGQNNGYHLIEFTARKT